MLGWKLIKEEEYEDLQKAAVVRILAEECHRWFSGWKDLDIIWDYIFGKDQFGGIPVVRQRYAKARGTDEYGKAKKP